MKKIRTLEFWLIFLPVLLIGAAWAAGFDGLAPARHLIPVITVTWTILAISWMFREIIRWLRDWNENA